MKRRKILCGLAIGLTLILQSVPVAAWFFFDNATKPPVEKVEVANNAAMPLVKVCLAQDQQKIELSADVQYYLMDITGKRILSKCAAKTSIAFTSNGSAIVYNGKSLPDAVLISTKADDSSCAVIYGGRSYRGDFLLVCSGNNKKTLNLINVVPLEKYLYSVIGSEISTNWPIEAVKAQAVAARSFALYNIGAKKKYHGFDMLADNRDQAYLGKVAEDSRGRKAVDDTRGIAVVYQGAVAQALFMASGGGRTASAFEVWGNKCAYLQSVTDYDEKSPYFKWEKTISVADFSSTLQKNGYQCGAIEEVLLSPLDVESNNFYGDRSFSGRVQVLAVVGKKTTLELSGNDVRRLFDLRSTLFEIKMKNGSMVFSGRGWGHGIGLSQWGAKQMAEPKSSGGQGAKYQDILRHYYSGIDLKKMY